MTEAISLAKHLNDMHGLAQALFFAACLAHFMRHPELVERLTADFTELSTRQSFVFFLPGGEVLRGWASSACGDVAEAIARINHGIKNWVASGATLWVPYYLALKAEVLYLADRNSEALEAIGEAEAAGERSGERWWCAELQRLRGVFLTVIDGEQTEFETSFGEAIRIVKEQKSVSLEKRAEATCAEYRRQKSERVRRTWIPATALKPLAAPCLSFNTCCGMAPCEIKVIVFFGPASKGVGAGFGKGC